MKKFFTCICVCAVLSASCGKAAPPPEESTAPPASESTTAPPASESTTAPPASSGEGTPGLPSLTEETLPRIDGSTATIPLGEALVALLLDIPRSEAAKLINFSGTNSSYTYLADGIRDLLISYEPPDEALRYKEEAEFEWDLAPIGRDALVFIVNDSNPVENITGEQAREIYTGEITNWKELGGADVEIEPFQRNETSGSQTLFIKLVMRDVAPMTPDKRYVQAGMAGLIESVASFNGTGAAIGYSVYYYAQNMNPADGLKFLGIDGVYPTRETVRDGSYPYVNDFYACVSSAAEADSVQRKIFDWLQTDEGRLLIENEGYVSVG